MEETQYISGYEKYKDIAEMIKKQCSKLEGKTIDNKYGSKTQYTWNGLNVHIGNGSVEIEDKDSKTYLAVYDNNEKMCRFAVKGGSDLATGLTGCYFPEPSDSYVNAEYQKIYSDVSGEEPFIDLPPDDITTIIQTEINEAEAYIYDDDTEYDKDLRTNYISNLKEGLDFFRNLVELAKNEKTQKETNTDPQHSQEAGVQELLRFIEQNGLSYNDLLLATVIKSGVKSSDVINLQQALIKAEQTKNEPNLEEKNSHNTEGK